MKKIKTKKEEWNREKKKVEREMQRKNKNKIKIKLQIKEKMKNFWSEIKFYDFTQTKCSMARTYH